MSNDDYLDWAPDSRDREPPPRAVSCGLEMAIIGGVAIFVTVFFIVGLVETVARVIKWLA